MRVKLSTLVLLLTSIALCVGWAVDRQRLISKNEREAIGIDALLNYEFRQYLHVLAKDPDAVPKKVRSAQMGQVLHMFQHRHSIRLVTRDKQSINRMVMNLLQNLNIRTVDEYFDELRGRDLPYDPLARYWHPDSELHHEFRAFLEEAVELMPPKDK